MVGVLSSFMEFDGLRMKGAGLSPPSSQRRLAGFRKGFSRQREAHNRSLSFSPETEKPGGNRGLTKAR